MTNGWNRHPFRILLYLEIVLLGIAILTVFSGLLPTHVPRFHRYEPSFIKPPQIILVLTTITSLASLGIMGWRFPSGDRWFRGLYIAIGFGLSWLCALSAGRGVRVFPVLLLIVVIRACLLFSWRGRIAIAVAAYVSFLSLEIMIWLRISPFGIPLGKPLPPPLRRLPPEELRGVIFGLTFNSALLFGLVLTFVLLLVGAMLAEHQSRAKLTLANRRLRQYALQIGDAQEALTNIAKHSQATQANLYLAEIANRIYLKLKDNGCGFNLVENTTGFGLQGMQERTAALGGKLEIFSQLGKGCEIRVEIPILGIVE